MQKTLLLDAGSGGRASQRLISDLFARHFSNDILNVMDDAALLIRYCNGLIDSFLVSINDQKFVLGGD